MKKRVSEMKTKVIFLLVPCLIISACSAIKNDIPNDLNTPNNNELNLTEKNINDNLAWSDFFDKISEIDNMENLDIYENQLNNKFKVEFSNQEKHIDSLNPQNISVMESERNNNFDVDENIEDEPSKLNELLDNEITEEHNENIANKLISLLFSSTPSNENEFINQE